MTALTNLAELDILDLLFTNVAFPDMGDAAGLPPSVGAGTMAIALHTGNAIDDTSTVQTQVEAAYTGYVRQVVTRGVAEWTVGGDGLVDNDNAITFIISTSGPETETDVSIGGRDLSNVMHIFGTLAADLIVNNGVTPEFAAGALDITAA
jgi:hypothetical protein